MFSRQDSTFHTSDEVSQNLEEVVIHSVHSAASQGITHARPSTASQ